MARNVLSIESLIRSRNVGMLCILHAPESYFNANPVELQLECNGVGPERYPKWILVMLTKYLVYFLPSTNIHDWEAKDLPNTDEGFKAWNDRLHDNIKRQYKHDYKADKEGKSWLNPKRAIAKIRRYKRAKAADLFRFFCSTEDGRKSFEESHDEC